MKMTDRAIQVALYKQPEDNAKLRIVVKGGGCSGFLYELSFVIDYNEDDIIEEHNGLSVVMDPITAVYMRDVELDYVDGLEKSGFQFNDPNATGSCGCGSSFSR